MLYVAIDIHKHAFRERGARGNVGGNGLLSRPCCLSPVAAWV
jgi:hypothetical protein